MTVAAPPGRVGRGEQVDRHLARVLRQPLGRPPGEEFGPSARDSHALEPDRMSSPSPATALDSELELGVLDVRVRAVGRHYPLLVDEFGVAARGRTDAGRRLARPPLGVDDERGLLLRRVAGDLFGVPGLEVAHGQLALREPLDLLAPSRPTTARPTASPLVSAASMPSLSSLSVLENPHVPLASTRTPTPQFLLNAALSTSPLRTAIRSARLSCTLQFGPVPRVADRGLEYLSHVLSCRGGRAPALPIVPRAPAPAILISLGPTSGAGWSVS